MTVEEQAAVRRYARALLEVREAALRLEDLGLIGRFEVIEDGQSNPSLVTGCIVELRGQVNGVGWEVTIDTDRYGQVIQGLPEPSEVPA